MNKPRPYKYVGDSDRADYRKPALGNEGAADAISALLGLLFPDRLQTHAHGRKNRNVQDGEDAVRKVLWFIELNGNAAKAEINDASTTRVLVAQHGVCIRSGHRDAFRFALHGVDALRSAEASAGSTKFPRRWPRRRPPSWILAFLACGEIRSKWASWRSRCVRSAGLVQRQAPGALLAQLSPWARGPERRQRPASFRHCQACDDLHASGDRGVRRQRELTGPPVRRLAGTWRHRDPCSR